ncbi:MAG: hypothetical protein JJU09_06880 [Rhodobacteraceae bacterium]|nr:hypothetical protein [Paracoccaceae bacterium]
MAYIDAELRNMQLVWSRIGDWVLVPALIVLSLALASGVVLMLSYGPDALQYRL